MSPLTRVAALAALGLSACDAPPPSSGRAAPVADHAVAATDPQPAADTTPAPTTDPEPDEEVGDPDPIAPTEPHDFSVLDLLGMDRISGHQVSPDGTTIVFVRRVTDLAHNKGRTDLWSVPVAGGEPTRLTDHPDADGEPQWSPDGTTIYFVSGRSGSPQVWSIPAAGGDATQVTDLPVGIGNLLVSPTGDRIAFSTDVFVDCEDLSCTKARLDAVEADPKSGKVYDRLFARHWDTYKDGRRSHLWTMKVTGGDPVDVTAGLDADVPSKPFGGTEEFAFSPDGKTIVYTARVQPTDEPWSTNFDLFAVSVKGGKPRNLTPDNAAWDTHPVFAPDGKSLAYTAMARPGFEADRFRIALMSWPEGSPKVLTEDWDRSVSEMVFSADGSALWTVAQDLGHKALFSVDTRSGKAQRVVTDGTIGGPAVAGDEIVFARHDLRHPTELWAIPSAGGEARAITDLNAAKVAAAAMGEPEQFTFAGAGGDEVYGWVVKPAHFTEGEKYPIAFLIHGGPQGSFGNMFHYRWNAQTYAGAGYGVVMIDFHGSTGYGQAFTDAIRKDWGGKPLVDLRKGLQAAVEKYPWLDADNACALGASYGGFMINWIAGQWPDGFKCLVNHDGVFDQRSMYYATEELWFPEWENGGPYYQASATYEASNPVRFVDRWKTPMLVVQGALDYRVPETQGLMAFTALQRQGIDSELLVFPDENHWVLRPANSVQWHDTVGAWLKRHLGR
jgi:dipeptidyl aminopeptidase/acylaminoacyl peptidase